MCVCVCVCILMYIYVYIYRELALVMGSMKTRVSDVEHVLRERCAAAQGPLKQIQKTARHVRLAALGEQVSLSLSRARALSLCACVHKHTHTHTHTHTHRRVRKLMATKWLLYSGHRSSTT